MKRLIGRVEAVHFQGRSSGGRNGEPYTGYHFSLNGHAYVFWARDASAKNLTLREGGQIEVIVSDGDLRDSFGAEAVYALQFLKSGAIFVSHRSMGVFRGSTKITAMSYADFRRSKRLIRLCNLGILFFGSIYSVWTFRHSAPLEHIGVFTSAGAVWAGVCEAVSGYYDFRWRSRWPTKTQRATAELYSLLGAGSPRNPASTVHCV